MTPEYTTCNNCGNDTFTLVDESWKIKCTKCDSTQEDNPHKRVKIIDHRGHTIGVGISVQPSEGQAQ